VEDFTIIQPLYLAILSFRPHRPLSNCVGVNLDSERSGPIPTSASPAIENLLARGHEVVEKIGYNNAPDMGSAWLSSMSICGLHLHKSMKIDKTESSSIPRDRIRISLRILLFETVGISKTRSIVSIGSRASSGQVAFREKSVRMLCRGTGNRRGGLEQTRHESLNSNCFKICEGLSVEFLFNRVMLSVTWRLAAFTACDVNAAAIRYSS
jgi:hypothetical protein